MIDLTHFADHDGLVAEFDAAGSDDSIVARLLDVYRTGVMFDTGVRRENLNESCIGFHEGLLLWHVIRRLRPALVIETGFGRGSSSAFFLSALAPWAGRLVSIDPAFRHWAGDAGMVYIHEIGCSARHELVEQPSEIVLPVTVAEKGADYLKFAYVDGSHHFDGTLLDFLYLDRLLEVGGVIGIDDANAPAVRTVASFIANNLPYRLHYPTHRLVLCQKTSEVTRGWSHFQPFQSSPRRDWDGHDEKPDSTAVPNATFAY